MTLKSLASHFNLERAKKYGSCHQPLPSKFKIKQSNPNNTNSSMVCRYERIFILLSMFLYLWYLKLFSFPLKKKSRSGPATPALKVVTPQAPQGAPLPTIPAAQRPGFLRAMCQVAEAPKFVLNSIPMRENWFQNQNGARLQLCWSKSPYANCKKPWSSMDVATIWMLLAWTLTNIPLTIIAVELWCDIRN